MTELNNKFGEVRISDEVIAKVAAVAVSEVKGAVGICDSTSGLFGIKNKTKGVRVETKEGNISVDVDIAPEVLAMIGSSVALSISDIPFAGPTGSVVVGCVDNEFIINPNLEQKEKRVLN